MARHSSTRACVGWTLVCAAVPLVAGCSAGTPGYTAPPRAKDDAALGLLPPGAPTASVEQIESVEAWSYNNTPGRLIRTPHYRVFTTQADTVLNGRVPMFLEAALTQYRTGITGAEHPLPEPDLKMDTFILRSRGDWALLTREMTGPMAPLYLRIPRGGFAFQGKALLFDIGSRDTLSIAAHEGWHQYTQRSFVQGLPVWLEEGVATYMEGHRWGGRSGGDVAFLPWSNIERFDQLRRSHAQGELLSLEKLLESTPQDILGSGTSQQALVYYAQVWALTHFLNEGAGGRYAAGLQAVLTDAAQGTMDRRLMSTLGPQGARVLSLRRGPGVFVAYFNANLAEASKEYDAFISRLVSPGARGPVVEGRSPLRPAGGPNGDQ